MAEPTPQLGRYARELFGFDAVEDVLTRACVELKQMPGVRAAWAAIQLPGADFSSAVIRALGDAPRAVTPEVRSALFGLQRQAALRRTGGRVERGPQTRAIFDALTAGLDGAQLLACPLFHRSGRLSGGLVLAFDAGTDPSGWESLLPEVASLTQAAVENVYRLSLARRFQERLLLLTETSDEALWDWDLSRKQVWWGGGIEALFGAGGVSVSNLPAWRRERIHPDDLARIDASFEQALGGEGSSWVGEYRFRRADGSWIQVRDRAWFLRETNGRAYRALGTLRDVTALNELLESEQQARVEAERASRVKDEFLAMLGHELRNPLSPIVSALELLDRQKEGAPERHLAVIRRQTQHLVRLVDDLLDIARITRGSFELSREPLRLQAVLQRAVEMVAPLVAQRRHRLQLELADAPLHADGARLTQVFSNLLTNAARYTPPEGNLLLRSRTEGDWVVVQVQDDGDGIEPELLPRMFEMFVQGHQPLDRAQGGLGLGLAIVRSLVALHGGRVELVSEGRGRGTTVSVWLPKHEQLEPQAPAPRAAPERVALNVLLVDDNVDAVELLAELLQDGGMQVCTAHDGPSALAAAAQRRPDVAVLDIGLPGMDGHTLARAMRQRFGPQLLLVALTGYGQPSDRQKSLEASFDEHLVKPVLPLVLQELIVTRCLARREVKQPA